MRLPHVPLEELEAAEDIDIGLIVTPWDGGTIEEYYDLGVAAVIAEGRRMIRGLRGVNLVGGDVVEGAPPFDPSGATLMYEILCPLAEIVAKK